MNISQVLAGVRDNLNAGGGGNTSAPTDVFWADVEIMKYINQAFMRLWRILRLAREDYFDRILLSTGSSINIFGEDYNPNNLQIQLDKTQYTLPLDLAEIRLLRSIEAGLEDVRFTASDIAREEFRVLRGSASVTGVREFLYDIVGRRTLVLVPTPGQKYDTELTYVRRFPTFREYKAGTITVTNGSTAVTGVSTAWVKNVHVGDELIVGTAIDTLAQYPTVASITNDTTLVLAEVYDGSSGSGFAYRLSPVSDIELEFLDIVEAIATWYGFSKGTDPSVDRARFWRDRVRELVPELTSITSRRQTGDPEFVQTYLEDAYGGYFY